MEYISLVGTDNIEPAYSTKLLAYWQKSVVVWVAYICWPMSCQGEVRQEVVGLVSSKAL